MSVIASQITSISIVYSTICWGADHKLRATGLCEGNSPVTSEFPAQRASIAGNISIWWRHDAAGLFWPLMVSNMIYFTDQINGLV